MSERKHIAIAEDLEVRLGALAEKSGHSVEELADQVLRQHVDDVEQISDEAAELERRWQKYQAGGPAIPVEEFRKKLHRLAAEAAAKAEI